MTFHLIKLLPTTEVNQFCTTLMSCPDWNDGKYSAIGEGKRNLQISSQSEAYKLLSTKVTDIILKDTGIIDYNIFPEKIFGILFSRTAKGMFYKSHLDTPYIPLGRRDYSFTLFLNSPGDYEGGELVLNIPPERKSIKLNVGEAVIYPTKYMHEVKEVTAGERLVCVGWIQSYIKDDFEREILANVKSSILNINQNQQEAAISNIRLAYYKLYKYFGS